MKKTFLILKLLIITLVCIAFNLKAYAQSNAVADAYATINESGANVICSFIVNLSDTTNVSQIQVTLGTASGDDDITTQTFNYDVTTGLGSGLSYSRSGNIVTLGVGTFAAQNTYFGEVKVKDGGGSWGSPYSFITN